MILECVIDGFPRRWRCPVDMKLGHWVHGMKHAGKLDLRYDYDVATDLGQLLDQTRTPSGAGLKDGDRIFITKTPGVAA